MQKLVMTVAFNTTFSAAYCNMDDDLSLNLEDNALELLLKDEAPRGKAICECAYSSTTTYSASSKDKKDSFARLNGWGKHDNANNTCTRSRTKKSNGLLHSVAGKNKPSRIKSHKQTNSSSESCYFNCQDQATQHIERYRKEFSTVSFVGVSTPDQGENG